MTIVSNKEFTANQKRYFNMAMSEDVCIKNGKNMFHLIYRPIEETNIQEQVYLEPDEDFYRAITAEELLERIHKDIEKKYANRK